MNRFSFSIVCLLMLFSPFLYAQKVFEWYQDGKVVFQTKVSADIKLPEADTRNNNSIDFAKVEFIQRLADDFRIHSFSQLHPELINDPLLVRTYQIEFDEIYRVEQLIEALAKLPFIEYAEKKELHVNFFTPNDLGPQSGTNNQWGLWKINAQQAWDVSQGSANIIVAVTDNAINNHPDLVNKFVSPRDVVDNDNDPSGCGSNDALHGTHVSGIVGSQTNNGLGVASIGFNVSVMPIKIGDCNGQLVGGYNGIIWAANNGAHVINMSWGGAGFSNYGQNVCNNAWNAGSILVAAAGNSGNSGNPIFYPAAYNNVIAVGNTTTTDAKNSSSQYGTWIDVCAPGTNIRSCNATTGYTSLTGTSMASPMVAGLLGLMKSHTPSLPRVQLINCLLSSADNIDAQNSAFIGQIGSGRINAHQAMLCITSAALDRDIAVSQIISPVGTSCNNTIAPEVVVVNYGGNTITSFNLNYQVDNNQVQTIPWSGTILPGNSVNVSIPSMFVSNGVHTFTAYTSDPNNNTDQNPSNDQSTSTFGTFATGLPVPFTETFEPNSTTTGLWNVDNPDESITWQVTNTSGTTPGNTSVGINFFSYSTTGQRDGLLSPPLDFSTVSDATLSFHHAYRRYNQNSTDSLIIYVSTNCGQTFTRIFQRGENGTGTFATVTTSTSNFVPQQASDWCIAGTVGSQCYTVNLDNYAGQPNVIIKFEGYNNYGNNLYIDNVNITGTINSNPPIAAFVSSTANGCSEQEVTFIDQSSAGANSWLWDIPGAMPSSSTQQNPTVMYSAPGTYTVTLTATNANGSNTTSSSFTVFASPATPVVQQNGNVLSTTIPQGHTAQWFYNGNAIAGSNGASQTVIADGTYTVVISNSDGCTASAGGFYGVVTALTVNEVKPQLAVYPNPARDYVSIVWNDEKQQQAQIEVLNSLGQVIVKEAIVSGQNNARTISTANWAKGIYFIRVSTSSTVKIEKLVVRP
jgi:PKD repeat protein